MSKIIELITRYSYVAILILEIVAFAFLVLYKLWKHHKAKKVKVDELAEVKKERDEATEDKLHLHILNVLTNSIIPTAIKMAEKSGVAGAGLKKLVAVSQVMQLCSEQHIKYEEYAELVSSKIEELIDFSKEVNASKGK